MRMNIVRSLQGAARASTLPNYGSSCRLQSLQQFTNAAHPLGRQATATASHGDKRVACWRNRGLGNRWVARRSFSTFPDDVLYLPMPKLSPSMTEGKVTAWHKAEGDEVNEYDVVMEITTDTLYAAGGDEEGAPVKMIVELVEAGFVGKLLVAEGDTVEVGRAVMSMCEEEENIETLQAAPTPAVDFYGGDTKGFRVATYQGYLHGNPEGK